MRVREDTIRRRDGSSGIYGVVDKPDFVVIVPVEDAVACISSINFAIRCWAAIGSYRRGLGSRYRGRTGWKWGAANCGRKSVSTPPG